MNIKKYFQFDEEPIDGWTYLGRLLLGTFLLILIVPGFWVLAATAYKRAGAFNWSKEFRIFCAIIIPVNAIFNAGVGDSDAELPLGVTLLALFFAIVHMTLLFKNGNKTRTIMRDMSESEQNIKDNS